MCLLLLLFWPFVMSAEYGSDAYRCVWVRSVMFGTIPRSLIVQIDNHPLVTRNPDWKSKEQAAEDLLFFIETLPQSEIQRLNMYADSFI